MLLRKHRSGGVIGIESAGKPVALVEATGTSGHFLIEE